jgi:hypothetical protein
MYFFYFFLNFDLTIFLQLSELRSQPVQLATAVTTEMTSGMLPSSDVQLPTQGLLRWLRAYAAVVGRTATYAVTCEMAQVCCRGRTYSYLRSN